MSTASPGARAGRVGARRPRREAEMHEYAIVQNLISQADRSVHERAGTRATRVVMTIEDVPGVQERFLRDAFDIFKARTTVRDAVLVLEQAPVEVWCYECKTRVTASDGTGHTCSQCGGPNTESLARQEIYLKSVEIDG